jgi:hypothetical protein
MRSRLARVIFLAMVIRADPIPPQLWIRGDTSPTDSGVFNFQIDGNTVAYNMGTGVAAGPYVLTPGAHAVTETAGTGTNLANYAVTFGGDCTDGKGQGAITVADGDTKTCVISRIGQPVLSVGISGTPDVSQARSGDLFNVQLDGTTVLTNVPVKQWAVSQQVVSPGRHRVVEVAGPGTSLANYTVLVQGDCGPDGTVTAAQDGKVRSCFIQNVGAYTLLGVLFTAPLGQSSGATLKLIAADHVTVLQIVTLKNPGDPAWDVPVSRTFHLNSPLQVTDVSSAVVSLVPAGSSDTWQIFEASVFLSNGPNGGGGCVFQGQPDPSPVLTQSSPNFVLSADDPASACANETAPVLSPPPGSFTCPQTVTITGPSQTPIFVTTDGTRPTGRSPFYMNPLTVSSTETISAIVLGYRGGATESRVTGGRYICATPPVCPSGQHCCSGIKAGVCSAGCINANIACKPLCNSGYKCCGGAGPTGACDDRCVPNSGSCF